MPKQLVIYDKESGVISHIMSFNFDIEIGHFEKLGLDKIYDFSKVGAFFEDDKKYINIKKDRIINGILTQQQARKEVEKTSNDSVFDDVQYSFLPEHVALITPWNEKCGISNYSKDLVDNLLCKVTIFCEKNNVPEYENPKVKIIPCWTNRDTSYDYLIDLLKKNKVDVVHVQYNHDLLNAGQLKIFGQLQIYKRYDKQF